MHCCTAGTDAILKHVGRMPAIEELDLTGIRVTDAGVGHLAAAKTLRSINGRAHRSSHTT